MTTDGTSRRRLETEGTVSEEAPVEVETASARRCVCCCASASNKFYLQIGLGQQWRFWSCRRSMAVAFEETLNRCCCAAVVVNALLCVSLNLLGDFTVLLGRTSPSDCVANFARSSLKSSFVPGSSESSCMVGTLTGLRAHGHYCGYRMS